MQLFFAVHFACTSRVRPRPWRPAVLSKKKSKSAEYSALSLFGEDQRQETALNFSNFKIIPNVSYTRLYAVSERANRRESLSLSFNVPLYIFKSVERLRSRNLVGQFFHSNCPSSIPNNCLGPTRIGINSASEKAFWADRHYSVHPYAYMFRLPGSHNPTGLPSGMEAATSDRNRAMSSGSTRCLPASSHTLAW